MNYQRDHEDDHAEHEHVHDDNEPGCPMIMTFHAGNCESILFKSLTVRTVEEFVFAVVVIFLISIAYKGLRFWREKLYNDYGSEAIFSLSTKASTSELTCEQNGSTVQKKTIRQLLTNKIHLVQTLLHLMQVTVSYSLMLIVMTFNIWLFFAIIFGAAFGYFLFGWIRQRSIEIAEHCH